MGLQKSHFNAESFLRLPWQTASLSTSIIRLLNTKKIEVTLLEPLNDLDSEKDIEAILNDTKFLSKELIHLLRSAKFSSISRQTKHSPFLDIFLFRTYYNKTHLTAC